MGVVYEGIDPKLNRQVAVKLILKSNINDPALEAEYSARFIREAQAVARLNHPNIVTVFDFGDENDVAFLVMELIQGKELKDYFDEKKAFGLDDCVRMIGELLDALDYAHKNGIVHRDIKPANVMLDGQMRVKLTDFGVARLSDAGADRTQAGTMVGTPSYMSPEQIEGLPVGPRSDIFAVGIILYQFLTGEKPFHAQGLWAIQKKIMQEDPVLPSVLNPSLNPAFDAVILRALAKKADDRYPTAGAFKDELKLALSGDSLADSDSTRLVLRPQSAQAAAGVAGQTRPPGTNPGISGTGTGAGAAGEATAGLEIEFWRSIKDSDDAEEFALYIQRFPNGSYVDLAKRKLGKLRGETTAGAGGSLSPPFANATNATNTSNTTTGIKGAATNAGSVRPPASPLDHDATNPGTPPAAAAGKKWLVPAAAVGVLAVAGIGYMLMSGGKPPAQPQASVATALPTATPTPAVVTATPTPDPAIAEAEKAAARKAEEEKQKLADDLAKKTKELEELKKAAANDPAKQAEIAKKAEEKETARKLADEQAKKRAEELLAKKKAAEDAKKEQQALADARKQEEAKKAAELAKKQEADKREAEARAAAAAKPTPAPAITVVAPPAATNEEPAKSASTLFADARALESSGKMKEALRMYKKAADAGNGLAAKRVGDILSKGEGGLQRDYGEALKYNGKARALGVEVQGVDKKD
jgi:serine/threonine-protein kinase